MAILTVSDVQSLCLGNQTTDSLQSLLRQAQSIAEGPEGAHRPLEKGIHTEIVAIGGSGVGRLSRMPILISPETPMTVAIRGLTGATSSAEWIPLVKDEDYVFDADLAEIRLIGVANNSYLSGIGNAIAYGSNRPRRHRPGQRLGPRVKASYTTGWDFQSTTLDSAGKAIKGAVTAILELLPDLNKSMTLQGLSGIYQRSYSMGNLQQQLERHLIVLRQWQPKEFM